MVGVQEMSAAAKKKAKKKAKEKAKKEAGGDAAPAAASGKKVNPKVRALQEQQELRRRKEEEARIAEEERLRQVITRWEKGSCLVCLCAKRRASCALCLDVPDQPCALDFNRSHTTMRLECAASR